MLKGLTIIVTYACILASCNNKPDANTNTSDKDSTEKGTVTINKPVSDNINRDEELQAMTALTTQDLEKLIPAVLLGVDRTDITSNNNVGTAMVIATYAPENSSEMRLTIMDCGGAGGAGAYNMIFANEFGQERNTENEYSKTIELNGVKAIEYCIKLTGDCSITWFTGLRYLVTLEGNNIETLKQAAKGLKIH